MTSATIKTTKTTKSSHKDTEREESERSERALGKAAAIAVPSVTVAACIVTGLTTSAGPAILVLVGGMLFGTICLLWASLRTLGGDAPLPEELEAIAARMHSVNDVESRKKAVLMSLKDLEHERAIGKVDESDYGELAARYREQAKRILRELDDQVEPMRERAEQIAQAHLKKRGLAKAAKPGEEKEGDVVAEDKSVPAEDESTPDVSDPDLGNADHSEPELSDPDLGDTESKRVDCPKCSISNEPDAAFCKKCGAAMRTAAKEDDSDASE